MRDHGRYGHPLSTFPEEFEPYGHVRLRSAEMVRQLIPGRGAKFGSEHTGRRQCAPVVPAKGRS